MTPGSNPQEIIKAGERALFHTYKDKSNGKTPKDEGYGYLLCGLKFKSFRSGTVAFTNFGCRKAPLLQVLFKNNEVASHVQFAKAQRAGLASLFLH